MFLESLIPRIPTGPMELSIFAVSILGMILIIYSQFLESLRRKDLIRMIGAICLAIYAVWDDMNIIFLLTFIGISVTSLIEFVEIYLGIHREKDHDVVKYRRNAQKK